MSLPTLCSALFSKGNPWPSKARFVRELFKAAGAPGMFEDSYGRKLFSGTKPFSTSLRAEFPDPVDRDSLRDFINKVLGARNISGDDPALQRIASRAGIRTDLTVEHDLFVEALVSWFGDIVRDGGDQSSAEPHYLHLLDPHIQQDARLALPSLYDGDKVDVVHPPALQNHTIGFYETFEHKWVLKNVGSVRWAGRSLQCVNPRDHLRPIADTVAIPDWGPDSSEFVSVCLMFQARGNEGKMTSAWRMITSDGDDCFPGPSTQFNVVATVTSSNLTTVGFPND